MSGRNLFLFQEFCDSIGRQLQTAGMVRAKLRERFSALTVETVSALRSAQRRGRETRAERGGVFAACDRRPAKREI